MIRGLYTAVSGMLSQRRIMDAIGKNLANTLTPGYRQDAVITSGFGEQLSYRIDADGQSEQLGTTVSGRTEAEVVTSFEQGAINETGRALDFAISGEGSFTLQQADGTIGLTRDGHFSVNAEGFLTGPGGSLVLGANGPVRADSDLPGALMITAPNGGEFTGTVVRGALETSNVDITGEMAGMMASSRAFQACSQIVKMMDQILQKSVNEIGRL